MAPLASTRLRVSQATVTAPAPSTTETSCVWASSLDQTVRVERRPSTVLTVTCSEVAKLDPAPGFPRVAHATAASPRASTANALMLPLEAMNERGADQRADAEPADASAIGTPTRKAAITFIPTHVGVPLQPRHRAKPAVALRRRRTAALPRGEAALPAPGRRYARKALAAIKYLPQKADPSRMRRVSLPCRGGLGGLLAAALLCPALAGCGESDAGASARRTVGVTERDFHIEAPTSLKTGTYTFDVANDGATDHELIIAPTSNGALPLRPDGLTVDEEAFETREPGSLEPGGPGARRTLTVHLAPGRYIFFCNMEGHFMAGMHTEVVVS